MVTALDVGVVEAIDLGALGGGNPALALLLPAHRHERVALDR